MQALADAAMHVTWNASVDSGTARAHSTPPGPEDKAYEPRANRAWLRRRGIRCIIPVDQVANRKGGLVGEDVAGTAEVKSYPRRQVTE